MVDTGPARWQGREVESVDPASNVPRAASLSLLPEATPMVARNPEKIAPAKSDSDPELGFEASDLEELRAMGVTRESIAEMRAFGFTPKETVAMFPLWQHESGFAALFAEKFQIGDKQQIRDALAFLRRAEVVLHEADFAHVRRVLAGFKRSLPDTKAFAPMATETPEITFTRLRGLNYSRDLGVAFLQAGGSYREADAFFCLGFTPEDSVRLLRGGVTADALKAHWSALGIPEARFRDVPRAYLRAGVAIAPDTLPKAASMTRQESYADSGATNIVLSGSFRWAETGRDSPKLRDSVFKLLAAADAVGPKGGHEEALGFRHDMQIGERNLLCAAFQRQMRGQSSGAPKVLVDTVLGLRLGERDLELGVVMERAGGPQLWQAGAARLALPELARTGIWLQLGGHAVGQRDRHPSNMVVGAADGAVLGYDNDLCAGLSTGVADLVEGGMTAVAGLPPVVDREMAAAVLAFTDAMVRAPYDALLRAPRNPPEGGP